VVLYDKQGKATAFGAETEDDEILYSAETEGWRKAEWYVSVTPSVHALILMQVEATAAP
jgi:hypothetical protein